jgi:hypothetical protein
MSFRAFSYHCCLWGGLGAFIGWVVAQAIEMPRSPDSVGRDFLPGLGLGLAVGIVDALSNRPIRDLYTIGLCGLAGAVLGSIGGLLSGVVNDTLLEGGKTAEWQLAGWGLLGLLVGAGPGGGDLVRALAWKEPIHEPIRKLRNGLIGGLLGGLLGGGALLEVWRLWPLIGMRPTEDLWLAPAAEHVVYGCVVGLLIAWAQIMLRDAWLRIESGLGGGRPILLSRTATSLGQSGSADIELHADDTAERMHAIIRRKGPDFILTDEGTDGGTQVNDNRIEGPVVLHSGDMIRIGRNAVLFFRRGKN